MRRFSVLSVVLLLATGVAVSAEAASTEATEETAALQAEPAGESCRDPYDPTVLMAAGFTISAAADAKGHEDCPTVRGCGGYNVTCRARNCSASDTGLKRCRLPDKTFVKCTRNTTIHVNHCGCEQLFQAPCCTSEPACLCAGCNSSSSFLSCQ